MGKPAKFDRKVRLFDHPLLERLTRSHPAVPLIVWGPCSLALIYAGLREGVPAAGCAALIVIGLFSWTLGEYLLHRWVFHWQPRGPLLRKLFYPVHQLHHDVQEWDRIVAPPLMALPLAAFFFTAFWLCIGRPAAFPFTAGFVIGYLGYDYTHYFTHFGKPRTWIGRGLRRRHLQHHFACPDRWFGVSSPLWDYVFRTHLPRGTRPRPTH